MVTWYIFFVTKYHIWDRRMILKKLMSVVCLALLVSVFGLPGVSNGGTQNAVPLLSNLGPETAEASVAGKSHVYYLSKTQVKSLYKSMKNAERYGGLISIPVSVVPVAGAAMALSASSVGKKQVEKAYHNNLRIKVTHTYGVTMSLNKTTFTAVK